MHAEVPLNYAALFKMLYAANPDGCANHGDVQRVLAPHLNQLVCEAVSGFSETACLQQRSTPTSGGQQSVPMAQASQGSRGCAGMLFVMISDPEHDNQGQGSGTEQQQQDNHIQGGNQHAQPQPLPVEIDVLCTAFTPPPDNKSIEVRVRVV